MKIKTHRSVWVKADTMGAIRKIAKSTGLKHVTIIAKAIEQYAKGIK